MPVLSDSTRPVGRLLRLAPENYRGFSFIHWSMTLQHRATGWLDSLSHARLRELLCHALGRYALVCPVYCIMPDHAHFLWVGVSADTNQQSAARLFREAWNIELHKVGCALQRQPFDHVLRERERERGAFSAITQYMLENPVRAQMVRRWDEYPFWGAIVPGYPKFDPREADFWERFWGVYARLTGNGGGK